MNLKQRLSVENSKKNVLTIVKTIGRDTVMFDALMQVFFGDDKRLTQRASWAMNLSVQEHPFLIYPYLDKMMDTLEQNSSVTSTRNIVRLLQEIELPEELLGKAFELCYEFVANAQTPIAVKAFSMKVLYNVCIKEPELKNEVIELLKLQIPNGSKGVKSRAKTIIRLLGKL